MFPSSKKLLKSPPASKGPAKPGSASKLTKSVKKPSPDKKGRQESMDKFVKKTDKAEGKLWQLGSGLKQHHNMTIHLIQIASYTKKLLDLNKT